MGGCIPPPTNLNLTISAEKSVSTSVKTFFFIWRPPDFGRKKRLNIRKISLNFGEDIRIFEVLCLKFLLSPPHQNFLDPPLHSSYIHNVIAQYFIDISTIIFVHILCPLN